MTDPRPPSATEQSVASNDEQPVTDGRYLYCLVDTTTAEPNALSATGIGDNPVYVIESETVGAVVHDCKTIYDTEERERVKRWLLSHQQVVDVAGDVFGTPLPLRFDTIFEGGDANVERWLREQHDQIREELTTFAGTWEYRIHLCWEPSAFEDHVAAQDDRLQKLQQRQQEAGAGKRFLLEKHYEKRLQELKRERHTALKGTLQELVTPVVNEMTEQESYTRTPLHEDGSSADRVQVTRLAVLADEDDETELGDRLDEFVEREGVEIRFTGPWPPYTFAPNIG